MCGMLHHISKSSFILAVFAVLLLPFHCSPVGDLLLSFWTYFIFSNVITNLRPPSPHQKPTKEKGKKKDMYLNADMFFGEIHVPFEA
jgi:hypothetical protein